MMSTLRIDNDNFVKAFRVFKVACKEDGIYTDWVRDYFPGQVEAKICSTGTVPDELRVLGVGSGSGLLDCAMMGRLSTRFPRIINRVVEPNGDHVARFKESAASQARQLRGVSFDWRQQTIEEYESARDSTRFHFISVVHSMYTNYMKDLEHSLMYLYDLLEPDGVLVVIMLSDKTGFCRLRERFMSSNDSQRPRSSADIRDILERRSVTYRMHTQSLWIDTTACMDSASVEGGLLLDFLLATVNFRQTAPEALQAEVLEYLRKEDCSVKKDDNAIFLNGDDDVIVIQKPSQ